MAELNEDVLLRNEIDCSLSLQDDCEYNIQECPQGNDTRKTRASSQVPKIPDVVYLKDSDTHVVKGTTTTKTRKCKVSKLKALVKNLLNV